MFQISTPGTTFNITAVPFTYKNGDKVWVLVLRTMESCYRLLWVGGVLAVTKGSYLMEGRRDGRNNGGLLVTMGGGVGWNCRRTVLATAIFGSGYMCGIRSVR